MTLVEVRADITAHAASKKVLACLEPILLASPQKALVNPNTHRTITDILADLAYNFGGEKGCEPLVDLWKKVKLPQEPDSVSCETYFIVGGKLTFAGPTPPG